MFGHKNAINMIKKLVEYCLSIPKSLYFCMRMLPFRDALRLPILIRYNVVLTSLSGCCHISGGCNYGMIRIGFGNIGSFDKRYQRTILEINGHIRFRGKCFIGHGSRIVVCENGKLVFGDRFYITSSSTIITFEKIVFGDDVLVSWDCLFMDTDFHYVIEKESKQKLIRNKEIIVGSHVWIGCRSTILKSSVLLDDTVVASNSVITKKIDNGSVLLAGNPAKIKKTNITWKRN